MFWILHSLREEIFSRLLSEVLASVQDSVQKEMGLGLEGLRQQLSEMITSSAQNTSQQSPSTAQTQVGCKYEFSRVTISYPFSCWSPKCKITPFVIHDLRQVAFYRYSFKC